MSRRASIGVFSEGRASDVTRTPSWLELRLLHCAPDAAGDVRQVPEDVESMLRELAARWRAEGRDDLLALEAPLQDLAAALLEHVDEGELPELMTASHPLF